MNHASLFSGIGGFDLAAQWMGWTNVLQVEKDEFCQKVLAKNFPDTKRYGDIKEFNGKEYRGAIDIISGGFPCQDISIAGRGRGITGKKSGLWEEMYRIIDEVRPKTVVIENSSELLKKGFEKVLYPLSEIGYNAEWDCIRADEYGLPHQRKRLWIVAYSDGFGWKSSPRILERIPKVIPRIHLPDKETNLLLSLKRLDRTGKYESVRMDDGFSKQLDKDRLSGCGNAIVPYIAYEIFKAIEQVNKYSK